MKYQMQRPGVLFNRASLALALTILLFKAPTVWAQDKQWDKHMKAGAKEYARGISKKYYWLDVSSQTTLAGAAEFAKAEREFLAALAVTQSFPVGDVRTADTLGRLADTYSQERRFPEAEERGKQAIAILERSLTPNNPDLGYASVGLANRALDILKRTGKVSPQALSHLKARALSFNSEEKAQVDRFVSGLEESAGASGKSSQ